MSFKESEIAEVLNSSNVGKREFNRISRINKLEKFLKCIDLFRLNSEILIQLDLLLHVSLNSLCYVWLGKSPN
jgi:hypothetical protein